MKTAKSYIFIWSCNNGYKCGCCGQWWEETEIESFTSPEAALEYAKSREHDERSITTVARIGKDLI